MVSAKTRREAIAGRLRSEGEASIAELATLFGTSAMTIRRDLVSLEHQGLARRVRGGAISAVSRSFEPPILQRSLECAQAKHAIGVAAAALVGENETVIVDVGTTTYQMARALRDDLTLTVVTSSLLIATELTTKPAVRCLVTGGVVRHGEMSLIGPRAQAAFGDLHCDAVFLGIAGLSGAAGLSEYNLDDAAVKRAAIASARRVILLADQSKLGHVALVTFAPLAAVDLLVTDAPADHPVVRDAVDRGVEVLHVDPHLIDPLPKENP